MIMKFNSWFKKKWFFAMYGADSLIIVILQHIANLCGVLRTGVKLGSIYLLVTIIHSWLVFRTRAILRYREWVLWMLLGWPKVFKPLNDRERPYYRLFTTFDIINLFIVVSEKMNLSRDFYFGVGEVIWSRMDFNFEKEWK